MKRVNVVWDHDDERYSQECLLLEEDNDHDVVFKATQDGTEEITDLFFQMCVDNDAVAFREVDSYAVFALRTTSIVKIEPLEEV